MTRPIVLVAMGCYTEPAIVHCAHVLQKLHFFQFFNFFHNLHDLPQKEKMITCIYRKKNNSFFFNNFHGLPQKKITRMYRKKITRVDNFFVHELHFSRGGDWALSMG